MTVIAALLVGLEACTDDGGGPAASSSMAPSTSAAALDAAGLYLISCSSCHGRDGGGTDAGPKLSGDETVRTFPALDAAVGYVSHAAELFPRGTAYGDPLRAGGQRTSTGGMPSFAPSLRADEVRAILCYLRASDPACP